MNKRIKQIALRCYTTVGDYSYSESIFNIEKFAGLIIQECVDIITPYSWSLPGEEYPHPISVIKDRFGIEGIKG
jgi:lysozyme family protein